MLPHPVTLPCPRKLSFGIKPRFTAEKLLFGLYFRNYTNPSVFTEKPSHAAFCRNNLV